MSALSYPPPLSPFPVKCLIFNKNDKRKVVMNIDLSFSEEINISPVLQKGSLVFLFHC